MRTNPTRRSDGSEALRMEAVSKVYGTGDNPVVALDGVSLSVEPATFTAVMGPSGSGKSTFLMCAAGLVAPTAGRVLVDGTVVTDLDETELARFRRTQIGFVFQELNLLPTLTVHQNLVLPLKLAGRRVDRAAVAAIVERVGLTRRTDHRPAELSGGERQRVALARAVLTNPAVIFADEPTGALDTRNAREVLALLRGSVDDLGQTVVMVTHDPVAASHADAVLFLADGRIVGHLPAPTPEVVAAQLTRLGDLADRRGTVGVGR